MLKTSILVAGIIATVSTAGSAFAESGIGGKARCPENSVRFVQTLSTEELQGLFGASAKPCDKGTTAAYFVCPLNKKFDVMCLKAEDLELAKKGKD